jgi:hypothetical protein
MLLCTVSFWGALFYLLNCGKIAHGCFSHNIEG